MFKKIIIISVLLLGTLVSYSQGIPHVDRMKKNVKYFTADSLGGRKMGSKGETLAAEYLYDCLSASGLTMLCPRSGQDFSINLNKDTLYSRNILGIVEGYDPVLKDEYIVIGAHLDNEGSNTLTVDGENVTQVFPGADNNASGLACLIELADMVNTTSFYFKRSIIFVGFGGMEMGMTGSWYFLNRAFSFPDKISLMIDLNMLGRKGDKGRFNYYVPDSNVETISTLDKISQMGAFVFPYRGTANLLSSDYLAFYDKGIPSVLLTTGKKKEHGTPKDTEKLLDYNMMESICGYVYNLIREVSDMEQMIVRNVSVAPVTEEVVVDENRLYTKNEVDKLPEFYHGDESEFLNRWVYSYLKYPELSIAMGEQGRVIVDFIVEADGKVSNVEIRKGIDDHIDAEVLKVISASPKWKPAQLNGKKVRVKMSVPVEFRLKKR